MIVCKVCGNRNNDQEEFCASCGRYLAWSGEHVEVAPEAEPELMVPAEAEQAAPRLGVLRRMAISLGFAAPSPERPAAAPPPAPAAGVVGAAPPARAAARAEVVPAAQLVPVAAGELGSGAPQALLVIPEVVGGSGGGSDDDSGGGSDGGSATMLAGAPGELRPRRPGEPLGAALPVLPPLPGHEPPAAERSTMLRRPTEMTRQGRPRRARAAAVIADLPEAPSPGDVFCSSCGQFNNPRRTYCRRCGHELHLAVASEALIYEPLTWWQRHLHRDVRVVAAGQRPGRWGKIVSGEGSQGRARRLVVRAGAVVIGGMLLLSMVGPYAAPLRGWYTRTWHAAYNTIEAKEVGVSAVSASATSSSPGHPAFSAVDGHDNTWWQSAVVPLAAKPPVKGAKGAKGAKGPKGAKGAGQAPRAPAPTARKLKAPAGAKSKAPAGAKARVTRPSPKLPPGVGQMLTVQFAPAISLNRLAWLSGATGTQFGEIGRPHEIELFLDGRHLREDLADTPSLQTFSIPAREISTLQVRILSVYSGTVRAVAITEIEFFHRS